MKLELEYKRYKRWVSLYRCKGRYGGCRPGPKKAPHALLKEEKETILALARDEEYVDLSHRQLAVFASETGKVEASPSTFYREMKKAKIMERREPKHKNPQEKPEVKPKRSNEIWSWDLTYIPLGSIFVYLFAIIDVYSRKIVGWHLSFNATLDSMKKAWDNALLSERLLNVLGTPSFPVALSDHGVQMAKKTAKQFFKDLGIKQLYARYQTPQDNAWIESWFRMLKYDCLRYKDYVSFSQLSEIISQIITYYNTQRYHGSIGYVTPEQMHNGQAELILTERKIRKEIARKMRLSINRQHNQINLPASTHSTAIQAETWAQAA